MNVTTTHFGRQVGPAFVASLVIGSLIVATGVAWAATDTDIKADREMKSGINQLAFAAEEIQDVDSNYQAGELEFARKGYKHAVRYFTLALQHFDSANLTVQQQKALADFKQTYDSLDKNQDNLDAETVSAARALFDRTHDYFENNSSD